MGLIMEMQTEQMEITKQLMHVSLKDILQNHTFFSHLINETDFGDVALEDLWRKHYGDTDFACTDIRKYPNLYNIYMLATFVIIAIGLVGNCLSICVFTSKNMRFISSNVYLLALAISDTFYLITVFLTHGLTTMRCLYFPMSDLDIFNQSEFFCKLLQYMLDLLSDFSCCLVISFTAERLIACYKPLRYKQICTVDRAKRLCLFLFLVIATSIFPSHIFLIGHISNFQFCTILVEYESTFTFLYMIEASVFRILPVLGTAIINVFIIYRMSSTRRHRNNRATASELHTSGDYTKNSMSSLIHSQDGTKPVSTGREVRQRQITITLFAVSTSYIITSIPALAHFLLWKLVRAEFLNIDAKLLDLLQNCSRLLYIAGFTITFFLYTITGSLYRKQLKMTMTCSYCKGKGHCERSPGSSARQTTSLRLSTVPNGVSPDSKGRAHSGAKCNGAEIRSDEESSGTSL